MASIDVLDWKKSKVSSVDLPAEVFEVEVDKTLLHTVVRWQLACRRQGTHQAQTRGMVTGSTKKPFKQKGTGNARQGTTKSPLLRGGGVIFGPSPRDYSYKVNKKIKKKALAMALSYLKSEGRLFVVKDMVSDTGKTKELSKQLSGFGVDKALLVDTERSESFERGAKNLKKFRYNTVEGVNVYDLLKYDTAILTEDSVSKICERCV